MSRQIDNLRRQLNDVQSQMARLQREAAERETRYQQEYNLRIHGLQRSMEQALAQNDAARARQLQQQMNQLRTELTENIRRNYDELKRELSQSLERRHQELMAQIQQYFEQLQNRVDTEVTDVLNQREEERRALAEREYQAALVQFQKVSGRAHEEVFPGQLSIYQGTLQQSLLMQQQNQMEASAATSVMLTVNLKDFEYRINDKLTQWLHSYLQMEQNYIAVRGQVDRELLAVDGEVLSEDTAMHWTSHKFDMIFSCLEECGRIINDMEHYREIAGQEAVTAETVERYFRTGEAETARHLDELTRQLKYELPSRIREMRSELVSAYRCLGQRKAWAGKIVKFMKEKHNTGEAVYNGFGLREEPCDERGLYCLEFQASIGNGKVHHYIYHIVPVVQNGNTENHIRVYMDFMMGNTQFTQKQDHIMIKAILKSIEERSVHIGIGRSLEVLEGGNDEEYSLQPDPAGNKERLVRHDKASGSASISKEGTKERSVSGMNRAGNVKKNKAKQVYAK